MMDSVTLTVHFKNRVRLFYPKHLPGPHLTMAIQKTFDLSCDDEVELVDRVTNEKLSITRLHNLPPNTHIVSSLLLKHNIETDNRNISPSKQHTLLSQEKTVVVNKQNGSLGFKVQYCFGPSQSNLASPYHRMATIFVKEMDTNGPAARAGLKKGDRILKVSGVSVFSKSLDDVVAMMKKREDYVVLSIAPWHKDYLQVEYPDQAYSEPDSDTSIPSLDRFSPLHTPPPHIRSPTNFNSLPRYPEPRQPEPRQPELRQPELRQPESRHPESRLSDPRRITPSVVRRHPSSPRCTRGGGGGGDPDTIPTKPPRPSYVLRREGAPSHHPHWGGGEVGDWVENPRGGGGGERDTNCEGSSEGESPRLRVRPNPPPLSTAPVTARPVNNRLSYSLDDRRKRFGNLECFEDFHLPEKAGSAGSAPTKEMDPLCEALISQSKISPHELQRLTSDCGYEGFLDCKIVDDTFKRHTLRGWTRFFTTLQNTELSLYKSYNDYVERRDKPEEGPVDTSNSLVCIEYRLKKNAFRVTCQNSKEYLFKADSNEEMLEWIGVLQKLNDNQSLCNNLIKRKADEILKSDASVPEETKNKKNTFKLKEYKQETDFQMNTQYDFPSFGSTIDKCIKCPVHKLVPAVVSGCIQEVEERGLHVTGLYRLSGNEKAIHSLINEIDKEPRGVDYKAPPWTDIHNTCAALKQFFRRLAEPLVPSNLYPAFMEAAQLEDHDIRHETLKTLVTKLPECHHATAKLLFSHLAKVAANAEDNKMHTYNLAIIFGPTVIRSQNNDMLSLVADMSNQYKVVECLITKFSYIFEEDAPVDTSDTQLVDTQPADTPCTDSQPAAETSSQLELTPESDTGSQTDDVEQDSISPNSALPDTEMGIFGAKKHKPSLNGLTTPTDDRTSIPTGWEFGHVIDRTRQVEKCDKSIQVNIPKSPPHTVRPPGPHRITEDKIVYKKEPVGIVHPYKDDIKMRPISRILDKKLVTLDTKGRDVVVDGDDRRSEPDERRRVVEPVKSLSLESLLDAMNTEERRHKVPARGNSEQYESIQTFVNGLHHRNGGTRTCNQNDHRHGAPREGGRFPQPCPTSRGATSANPDISNDCTQRKLPARPVNHHPGPAAPYRKSSLPDEHEYMTSRDHRDLSRDIARVPAEHRSQPSPAERHNRNYNPNTTHHHHHTSMGRSQHSDRSNNPARSHQSERSHHTDRSHHSERVASQQHSGQEPPRWIENMLHTQRGGHPSIPTSDDRVMTSQRGRVTSRSHDQISRTTDQRVAEEQKPRRHSEARGRRQPGHTHKWVLDNNTTLLESTL